MYQSPSRRTAEVSPTMKCFHGPVLLLLGFCLGLGSSFAQPAAALVPAAVLVPTASRGQSRLEVRTVTTKKNGKSNIQSQTIRSSLRSVGAMRPGSSIKSRAIGGARGQSITLKAPTTAAASVSTKAKSSVHPRFGGPGTTVNSQAFPNTTIGGTPSQVTLNYPSPDSSTTYTFTIFSTNHFSIVNGECNADTCYVNVGFNPLYPGLLKDAVLVTDENGNLVYETYVYGTGVGPQFGYDFGNESLFGTDSLKPAGIAVGPDGNYYIGDQAGNQVYEYVRDPSNPVDLTTSTNLNFTNLGTPAGLAVGGSGTVYVADQTNNVITYLTTAGLQGNLVTSTLAGPQGLAVDGTGALYLCDTGNNRIIKIDNQGTETTVVTDVTAPQAVAIDSAGDFFYSDTDNGGEILEVMASDGSTHSIGNQLGVPQGLGVDAAGRVYYSTPAGFGSIDPVDGTTTFGGNSAGNDGPYGVALDNNGDILRTQPADGNFSVTDRKNSNFILSTTPGSTTSGTITAENTGNDMLSLSSVTIPGPEFSIEQGASTTCVEGGNLPTGQTCQIVVDFTPPDDSTYQENLVVTSNSLNASGTQSDFTVKGIGQGFATTTTLSTSTGAALTGSSVTLTATVGTTADTESMPTGSVNFTDNNSFLATVQLAAGNNTVSYTTSSLPTEANEIQAVYGGDSLFATSSSSIQNVQIDAMKIQAAVSLEVSPANVVLGQPETLTALVAGEYTPPTGTVTFSDQNGVLGTVATSGSGSGSSATLTLSTLSLGSHTVTATYNGDATFIEDTSDPETVNVAAASTSTTLTITPTTTAYQTPVTFRASTIAHSGQVLFCDASAPQCSVNFNMAIGQINSDGIAIVHLPAGTIGTHNFIARYLGIGPRGDSAAIPASTSAQATVTVTGMYPSSTTVTSTGTANPYSLTGTVVGVGSPTLVPTGSVTFNDTSNGQIPMLGSANLGASVLSFTAVQPAGSPIAVGSHPYGVATGDFNGDGFMDVVTENYYGNSVSVLLGNGDGTFQPAVSYGVGTEPERVLVADFNGDGFLDLVVANTGSGTVSVLLGNGDGTFQSQVTYGAGSPVGLGVLDLNHDGFPDIAAGDYYDGTMSVLINNGDGTFQAAVTYPTSSIPQTLAEGDFDGDGNVDIVVGNLNSNNVGVFLGNGDGTFRAQVTYAVGGGPQGVQVGDFNGDGKADLAVVNSSDNTLSILLGNGDGTFQAQVTYPVGSSPVGLVIADFNNDGRQDIAVSNTAAADLTEGILLGNGDGTFQTQIKVPVANFPYGAAAADLNGDGYPDLAISAFNNSQATILLSEVTQTATANINAVITGTGLHNLDAVYAGDTNFSGSTSPVYPLTISAPSGAVLSPGASSIVGNGGVAPGSPTDYTFFGNMNVEFGAGGGGQPTVLTNFSVSTLSNVEYHGNSNYTAITAPGGTTPFTTGSLTENPTNYPNTTPHTTLLATFSPLNAGSFTVYILDGNTDGVYVGNSSVGLGVNGGAEIATASQALSGANEFTAYTVTGAQPTDVFQVYATTSTNAYPTIGALTFSTASATLGGSAVSLTASPTTQTLGGSVGFSVTVSGVSQTSPAPTGTVTLVNTSVTPNATVGTINLGLSGTGTLLTSMLPAGQNAIVAMYSGDSVYASSSSLPQTVTITTTPPVAVIDSRNFGSAVVAGTPITLTLSYNQSGSATPVAAIVEGSVFSSQAVSCSQGVCSIQVTFAPAAPGLATDALTLRDGNGNLLDETFLYGTGTAPQLGYDLSYGVVSGQTHSGTIKSPASVAVGPDKNVYIADNSTDQVYQVNPSNYGGGTALGITGLGTPAGVAVSGDNTVYVVDQSNNLVRFFNPLNSAQGVLRTSTLSRPSGIAVDGTGAIYVVDTGNGRIEKIDNQGNETTVAQGLNAPRGIALDSAGDVFYGDSVSGGEITELGNDSGSPVSIGTNLGTVNDLAVEPSGRVYFATMGGVSAIDQGVVRANGYLQLPGNTTNYGVALDPFADLITTNTSGGTFLVTNRRSSAFEVGTPIGTTQICCDFVSNTGNTPLTIGGLGSEGAGFTVDAGSGECQTGQSLAPGRTCSVNVDFTPTAAQNYSDTLTVTSDSLNAANLISSSFLSGPGQMIATATSLSISPAAATVGQTVTLTATLAPSSSYTTSLTGTVNFVNSDGSTLGSAPLNGLSAQLTLTTLAQGSYSVTAVYLGDSLYATSTSTPQSLTVAASTALALTAVSPNSGAIGSPATTITLSGANFSRNDVVLLNATALASAFVNATTLTAVIPASFFTSAGTGMITVHDGQSGMTSAAVTFTVSSSPQIVLTGPSTAVSGQQPSVTFQLVNPYPVALAGSLTLTFAPSTSSGINDPAVQFASGGRTLDFNIPADSTATPGVQLQTGTVAGTATISLVVSANGVNVTPTTLAPVTITIPPAAPTITSSSMTRSGDALTVSVVGFSNTREALQATFHFNAVAGATIDNPDVTLTVGSDFSGYYVTPGSDAYGSAFTYNQVFTLDQDAAAIQNVTVTLTNTIGSSSPSTTP